MIGGQGSQGKRPQAVGWMALPLIRVGGADWRPGGWGEGYQAVGQSALPPIGVRGANWRLGRLGRGHRRLGGNHGLNRASWPPQYTS